MLILTDPAADSAELGYVRRALEQGELVVVPTDTVYGIAALASDEVAVRRLYDAKGRTIDQATAVIFPTVDAARDGVPGLSPRGAWAMRALLPGPWTLIVDNPEGVLPWLTGGAPAPIGVRVPSGALDLPAFAATSANRSGEPTARRVQDLDGDLAGSIACAIDRGELPPDQESTVLDLVAWERGEGDVRVLRDTAGRAGQALAVLVDVPG